MVHFGKKFNKFMNFGRKVISSGANLGRKLLNHSATVSTVANIGAHGLKYIAGNQGYNADEAVGGLSRLSRFAQDVHDVGNVMNPHIVNSQSANFV